MRSLLAIVVLSGCVGKGKYELAAVQLDATRIALSARTGQTTIDQLKYEERIEALQAEIVARQAQLDELTARSELRQQALDEFAARTAMLVARLEVLRSELVTLRAAQVEPGTPAPQPGSPWDDPAQLDPADEVVAQMALALDALVVSEREAARENAAHQAMALAFAPVVQAGNAELLRREGATVLRVPSAKLYQEGWTNLSPRGQQIVEQIALALRDVPGRQVVLEGHTDDRPRHSADFPSNWERGFFRALGVLRALESLKVPATLAVASYADARPAVPHADAGAARVNARVDFVVSLDQALMDRFTPTPADTPDPDPDTETETETETEPEPEQGSDASPWGPSE